MFGASVAGERTAEWLGAWARWVARNAGWALIFGVAVSAFCIAGIGRLQLALSIEDLLLEDDPARVVYDELRARFDSDESLLVLVQGDVFSPEFLSSLEALHADLAGLDHAERVESLVNARVTRSQDDVLVIDEWLAREPAGPDARRAWVDSALENPSYRNLLVSRDARTAALMVILERPAAEGADADVLGGFETDPRDDFASGEAGPGDASGLDLLTPADIDAVMRQVEAIVAAHRRPGFEIRTTGGIAMTDAVSRALERDMSLFTVASVAVIAALLLLLFARLAGVGLPVVTALVPMLATFGVMGWVGLPVTPATQLVPSLLIAIGVAQSVHLLTAFFQAWDAGADRIEAIGDAFRESGVAVAMATVTTAFGLGSFAAASLNMLVGLGIAATIGVGLVFASGFVLLPALLALVPIRRRSRPRPVRARIDGLVGRIGVHAVHHPVGVCAAWAACVAGCIAGASLLEVRNDPLGWFPDEHEFVAGARLANESLGGALPITVAVDSGRSRGLLEPKLLEGLDDFEQRALALEAGGFRAGASVSLVSVVKETHRALSDGDPAAYAIPSTREAVAQEILLFESAGPDELSNFVDDAMGVARMTLMVPLVDNRAYLPFAAALERAAAAALPGVDVTLTGIPLLSARSNEVMMGGLLRSYGLALALIVPLLIAIVGSWRIGLLGVLPNLAPILLGLGLMYVLDIDLDAFTALIASVAIGLAVDDTIHFLHGWSRARERLGSHEEAVEYTLRTTGSALVTTSLALSAGFAVFMAAEMVNVTHLGLVTTAVIAVALLADVQLCPALLSLSPLRAVSARTVGVTEKEDPLMTVDTWRPLPRPKRRAFESRYLEYLRRRNGVPDFDRHTASAREQYVSSIEGRRLRSRSGAPLIDVDAFERHQVGDAARANVDEATLWAICTANVNFTEQFGVEYGYEKLLIRPGEPLAWIMIEETYHTRLLLDCAKALGAHVRTRKPAFITSVVVRALSRFPHLLTDPLILCTELVASIVLRQLWARGREIFADEPEVLEYIQGAYHQILVDEVSHVRNLQSKLGWFRLALARVVTFPLAAVYLRDLPEVVRCLGRDEILSEVWDTVVTGRAEVGDGRVHPLDLLEEQDDVDDDRIADALWLTGPRA